MHLLQKKSLNIAQTVVCDSGWRGSGNRGDFFIAKYAHENCWVVTKRES